MNQIADEIQACIDHEDGYLAHYGTPRHSGRYPWGSGENPYQHPGDFLSKVKELKKEGLSETQIAKHFSDTLPIYSEKEMSTTELRAFKSLARAEERSAKVRQAQKLKEHGYSNVEIGKRMGLNESSVRSLLDEDIAQNSDSTIAVANRLKQELDVNGGYLDIGTGVERNVDIYGRVGVSDTKMKTAVTMLQQEGYEVFYIKQEQMGMPGQYTTIKVLAPPGTQFTDVAHNKTDIHLINGTTKDDGKTWMDMYYPQSISSDRIKIRYGEEGGSDMDGVIQLRRGVKDIDLDKSQYAQVRVAVDGTHYLKGMAIYAPDSEFPKGVDIIYNSNKAVGTPKEKVFKELKNDPDNPFGAVIKKGGQRLYADEKGEYGLIDGAYKKVDAGYSGERYSLSAINKVREEGEWGEWSRNLSAQFLSKQNMPLIKRQLDLSYQNKLDEFMDISAMTNPTLKKKMLQDFAESCDAAASDLKAAALPGQAMQVILPVPSMKDTEIYAPNYKNGTVVALVRYPHAGTFEIPVLTVNNNHPNAKDAVGINSKVAEKLSGADFDGDTVLVIPMSEKVKIKSSPTLPALDGFNTKSYKFTEEQFLEKGRMDIHKSIKKTDSKEVKELKEKVRNGYSPTDKDLIMVGKSKLVITSENKQNEMGKISNLITDMTLMGANQDELARAVKHSMVVIDAEKHELDYKKSYQENGIAELKQRYRGSTTKGASTLLSLANSEAHILERKEGMDILDPETGKTKRLYVDPKTGEKLYTNTNRTYKNKHGEEVRATETVSKMSLVKDARDLVSDAQTAPEMAYANYANKVKALANRARKLDISTKNPKQNPSARKTYAREVESLNAKLDIALKNSPRERQAQLLADSIVRTKRRDNPGMTNDELKKLKQQALASARATCGANKKDVQVVITDKEWEAIQAGAVSTNTLEKILANTDSDKLKERAMPRENTSTLSDSKQALIRSMNASGYSTAEIAERLGVSTTTVAKYS